MKFLKRLYKFVKFQKSKAKNKKYSAILKNKETNRTVTVTHTHTLVCVCV